MILFENIFKNRRHITILFLAILLSSCSIRTDGAMSYNNTIINMIYFEVDDYRIFISELEKDFGKYEKGKRESEYWWKGKIKEDWSNENFDMKLINTGTLGYFENKISIAILTKSGKTLTERGHSTFPEIKKYFSNLKKITKKKNK
jgi:hypothetical protein